MDLEKEGYEVLSDHAEPGSPKYKKLRRQASRAGALAVFGDDLYVHKPTLFNAQMEDSRKKKDARAQKKVDSEITAYRYRKIYSLRVLKRLEERISTGITNKKTHIKKIAQRLEKEKDLIRANDLEQDKRRLENLVFTSEQKLQAVRDRIKEIEKQLGESAGSRSEAPTSEESSSN